MAKNPPRDPAPATRLVTSGRREEWTGPLVNPPVSRGSTHLYPNTAALGQRTNADGDFFYGRRGAPSQWALAEALTELEPGAAGTMLYPSGVAAISATLLTVLTPGDVLLMTDNAYDPSRTLGKGMLKEFGIETRFFPPNDVAGFEAAICDRSRAVLLESPGSLTMEVQDVPALARIAREHGLVSVIDNTWASPLGFQCLRHGVDISVISLTKHIGGHSDLMMGSATAGEEWYGKLRRRAQALGQIVSPDDAALALRGLRTLAVRLERQTASALEIAARPPRDFQGALSGAARRCRPRSLAAGLHRGLRPVQRDPARRRRGGPGAVHRRIATVRHRVQLRRVRIAGNSGRSRSDPRGQSMAACRGR
jgi:cysteine-S-conjugate beta-lyase